MAFHHKIQPHHHVSIWAVAVLSVIASIAVYNNQATAADCTGSCVAASPRPSEVPDGQGEKTESESGTKFVPPAACTGSTVTHPQTATDEQRGSLVAQENSIAQHIEHLKQDENGMTDDQKVAAEEQLTALQQQADALKKQIEALPSPTPPPTPSTGPGTGACKKAVVSQEKANMQKFRTKIHDTMLPKFAKIEAVIATVTAKIPDLQAAGVSQDTVTAIQADLTAASTDEVSLKSYFTDMQQSMDTFNAEADNDSGKAFDGMKGKFDATQQAKISAAAQDMITHLNDLQKILSQITG